MPDLLEKKRKKTTTTKLQSISGLAGTAHNGHAFMFEHDELEGTQFERSAVRVHKSKSNIQR